MREIGKCNLVLFGPLMISPRPVIYTDCMCLIFNLKYIHASHVTVKKSRGGEIEDVKSFNVSDQNGQD